MIASGCVTCPRPVPDAAVRVFLMHHAGGSHLLYRDWPARFPVDWEVCPIEAPGRGRLTDRPLCHRIDEIVEVLVGELPLWMDRPFAFFGHSMGALVGYELTLALGRLGLPQPLWLGLSARGAPGPDGQVEGIVRHRLPSAELRQSVIDMGGTPRAVVEDAELWALIEPVLRADLEAVETWRLRPGTPQLSVPVSAFCGQADVVVSPAGVAGWAERTSRFRGLHVLPGGHFYFQSDPGPLISRIVAGVLAEEAPPRLINVP